MTAAELIEKLTGMPSDAKVGYVGSTLEEWVEVMEAEVADEAHITLRYA